MQLGNEDLLNPERLETNAGADDVCDRIQGANFVEVDVFGRHPVDLPFRHGDALEHAESVFLDEGREIALFNQLTDLTVSSSVNVLVVMLMTVVVAMIMTTTLVTMLVSMGVGMRMLMIAVGVRLRLLMMDMSVNDLISMIAVVYLRQLRGGSVVVRWFLLMSVSVSVFMSVLMSMVVSMSMTVSMVMAVIAFLGVRRALVNAEVHALDLLTLGALEVHVEIAEVEFRQLPFKRGRLYAQITEGTDEHVTADPREAVQIEGFHLAE